MRYGVHGGDLRLYMNNSKHFARSEDQRVSAAVGSCGEMFIIRAQSSIESNASNALGIFYNKGTSTDTTVYTSPSSRCTRGSWQTPSKPSQKLPYCSPQSLCMFQDTRLRRNKYFSCLPMSRKDRCWR